MEESVRCPKCGMVSTNPNDVKNKYCNNCKGFYEDLLMDTSLETWPEAEEKPKAEEK